MVKRNLSLPHRFVCMTDNPSGYDEGVETLDLKDYEVPQGEKGFEANQLIAFAPKIGDLKGKMLVMDLDVVIVDSLDPFFEYPGEFCIIHDWLRPDRITGNSSVVRVEVGKWTQPLDNWLANREEWNAKHRTEQEYVTHQAQSAGVLNYWPKEWCVSFKRNCLPKFPMNLFKTPELPKGARIVVFHGHPKPDEARDGKSSKLFRATRPTPWVGEHWK